jgi:predicted DNA-binding transcriptional regulator YafY
VVPFHRLIEPIDKQSCFFEVGSSSFESLAAYIASFGVDFEVTEPPELVDQVRRLASRLSRAAAAP